jgi:hypothetical protein
MHFCYDHFSEKLHFYEFNAALQFILLQNAICCDCIFHFTTEIMTRIRKENNADISKLTNCVVKSDMS